MLNQRIKPRFVCSSVLFLAVLVIALFGKDGGQPTLIHGAPPLYTITLNGDNAPTLSDTYVNTTQTARNTQFQYRDVKYSAGNHIELSANGGILNPYTSQITSITGVTATFTTTGTFTLFSSYDMSNYFSEPLVSGVRQELPFLPYFVEFWADGSLVVIESIVITYTCAPHETSYDLYRVSWYNEDGNTLLEKDIDIAPSSMPSYDGPLPTKDPFDGEFYSFAGWDQELLPVESNQVYYATYTPYSASYSLINGGTSYQLENISTSSLTSISIPSTYNGRPVTSIADEVFANHSNLAVVDLPATLTTIGYAAFAGCTSLTSVHLPASLTTLGNIPFAGCTSLTSITVDGANENFSSNDGILFDKAGTTLFMYPVGRSGSFSIPSGITAIGDGAFFTATQLTSVTIPASVTTLGINVFFGCSSLNHVVIPDTVTSLGGATFINCTSLTDVTLPSGLTALPYSIFQGCTNLATVTLPDGITDIEMDVFTGCSSLTSIALPGGVTRVGPRAFMDCVLLGNVTFPEGLLSIDGNAFTNCDSMTAVTIPASATSIGASAFSECANLAAINVDSMNTIYSSLEGVLFDEDLTTLMCYPAGKTDATYMIPSSVTTITTFAFRSNTYLTSVIIPDTVTTIGASGFYTCPNVTLNCFVSAKPAGWDVNWNASARPVVWGYVE